MEGEHLDVSFHTDVGQVCCVLDDVSMITLIKRRRKTCCNTHRNSSRLLLKNHANGVLETMSFQGMLFNDG